MAATTTDSPFAGAPDAVTSAELLAVFNDPHWGVDGVCEANGITREEFGAGRGAELRSLELFLLVIPRCPPLKYFSNLTHLKLLHLGLQKIEHLDTLHHLRCLWLGENDIVKIEGLDKCRDLEELYLNTNAITKIEGLSMLTKLRVLWLQSNEIEVLEGLETLTSLRALCVASNKITTLGTALATLTDLEEFNASGNLLSSFREILPLADLPNLERLWLSDAVYGANPLCGLCNYQTFTLFSLRMLKMLDYQTISPDQRLMAESTFLKKKIYYSMRTKTLKRNARSMIRKAEQLRASKESDLQLVRGTLLRCLHEVEAELLQFSKMPSDVAQVLAMAPGDQDLPVVMTDKTAVGALRTKKAAVIAYLDRLTEESQRLHALQSLLVDKIASLGNSAIARLVLELHTGGNVRLEDGKLKDVWYQSCSELLRTRFFASEFEGFGVKELRVSRVSKIHNRALRTQFDAALEKLVDTSDAGYKRALEYLFIVEANGPLSDAQLYELMEFGVSGAPHKPLKLAPPVPPTRGSASDRVPGRIVALTNSAYVAEHRRLQIAMRAGELLCGKSLFENPHLSGRVIVAKAFLGMCSPEINPAVAAGNDVPLASTGVAASEYPDGTTTVFRSKHGDSKQRLWFALDPALVLPEYVIEYGVVLNAPATSTPELFEIPKPAEVVEVVTKAFPKALPADVADLRTFAPPFLGFAQCCTAVAQAFNRDDITQTVAREPNPPKRAIIGSPPTAAASEAGAIVTLAGLGSYLMSKGPADNNIPAVPDAASRLLVSAMDRLHVVGVGASAFDDLVVSALGGASKLTRLILPFNDLNSVAFLASLPQLTYVDVSFNVVRKFEGLPVNALPLLTTLKIESNLLYRTEESASIVAACPALESVAVLGNPVCELRSFIDALVLGGTRLTELDAVGGPVQPVRAALQSRPDVLDMVAAHAAIALDDGANLARRRIDIHENLLSYTGEPAPLAPAAATASGTPDGAIAALRRATALTARGQRIAKCTCLAEAKSLKLLDLGDNRVADLSALGDLPRGTLEALMMDGNLLRRLDDLRGVAAFDTLRRVDVSRNQLTRLDGIEAAKHLTFLSAEGNSIVTIAPLAELASLSELYLSNNKIAAAKEVLHLRGLARLIIADFSSNPCAEEDQYRLYAVFQLKKLKVLDGASIDAAEQAQAKDVYAGRISADLLNERLDPVGTAWSDVSELNLANCGIKDITLLDEFPRLQHLALNQNLLVDISGLQRCVTLVSLDLAFNKLGMSPIPLGRSLSAAPYLESLSLEANGIQSIAALQLDLQRLKFLNLKGNEVQRVDGLDQLPNLRELILDRNKLRTVDGNCFSATPFLRALSCDENAIKVIEGTRTLQHLQRISFGSNRIAEIGDILRAFEASKQVTEATFMANQGARKNLYRISLVNAFPMLTVLDGKEVTADERERAESYFTVDSQLAMIPPNVLTDVRPVVPVVAAGQGRPGAAPLRVMNLDAMGIPPEVQVLSAAPSGQFRGRQPAVPTGPAGPGGVGGYTMMPAGQYGKAPMGGAVGPQGAPRTNSADVAQRPRPKASAAPLAGAGSGAFGGGGRGGATSGVFQQGPAGFGGRR